MSVLAGDILIHGISITKAMITSARDAKAGSWVALGGDLAAIATALSEKKEETMFIY